MAVSAFQKILNRLFKQFVNLNGREPMTPKEWMNIQNEAVQFFNRTKGVTTPKKEPFQGFKPKVIEFPMILNFIPTPSEPEFNFTSGIVLLL